MKPTPADWPRISSALYYEDVGPAIDWLCDAFGFEVKLKVVSSTGRIEHSELVFGGGLVMVGEADKLDKFPYRRSPTQVSGVNTQNMMVYVDDVEAHCARARAAGAEIVTEPQTTDYGEDYWTDRMYECVDIGGHHWWFSQRLRNPGEKA
ncbi:MAG: VOC family protein [Polyangiaceae bacterium]|nr:VOC family protein [Polyangiaceae bacterium]